MAKEITQLRDPSGAVVANALAPISSHARIVEAMRNVEEARRTNQGNDLIIPLRHYVDRKTIEFYQELVWLA